MNTIAFPHMGNYYVPVKYLLSHITNLNIMIAPPITNKTIELGNKYSKTEYGKYILKVAGETK